MFKEREMWEMEMMAFLPQYGYWRDGDAVRYSPTKYGIGVILDEYFRQKGNLLSMFQRHPNYNGRGQIVLKEDFHRMRDYDEVELFTEWLYRIAMRRILIFEFKKGEKVLYKGITYETVEKIDNNGTIECVSRAGRRKWLDAGDLLRLDGTAYAVNVSEEKSVLTYQACNNIINLIHETGQYVEFTETDENGRRKHRINDEHPWLRMHNGEKLSRVVQRFCRHYGIDKETIWNTRYGRFCDAVNPLVVTRWTILSINPIDYWTMSFGNSWSSCMSTDKTDIRGLDYDGYEGMYSGGTESYMLDGHSIVVYVVDSTYDGDHYELEDKILRQMFHIGENIIIQGRLYPQDNDCGAKDTYDSLRNIVQHVISECQGRDNYWSVQQGVDKCRRHITTKGVHYPDYHHFDNCTVSLRKGTDADSEVITVGHKPICPECGKTHGGEDNIMCSDCVDPMYCEHCGERIYRDDEYIYAEGSTFCCDECVEASGYVYCKNDDGWHFKESRRVIYDCYINGYYYKTWYGTPSFVFTEDGRTYGCPENAIADNYRFAVDGKWYPRDLVEFDMEVGVYVPKRNGKEVA